jgi:hypothetical protein
MGIEDQVREAYRRVGRPEPDELGAYDRFLRRGQRRTRQVRAAVAAGLALLLAVAFVTPRLLGSTHGAAGGSGQLLNRHDFGFTVPIPPGWELTPRPATGSLPASPTRYEDTLRWRGSVDEPPAQIAVQVTYVVPQLYPGGPPAGLPRTDAGLTPEDFRVLGGWGVPDWRPQTQGRRADGRAWNRYEHRSHSKNGDVTEVYYTIAWPYACAPGVRCPQALKLRALTLRVVAGAQDFPAADAAARRIVQTARPVGNAVQAPPAAARPRCDTSGTGGAEIGRGGQGGGAVRFTVTLKENPIASCQVRTTVAFRVRVGDSHPAQITSQPVTVTAQLPEDGHISLTWQWENWCYPAVHGGFSSLLHLDPPGRAHPLAAGPTPRCVDPHKPSTVKLVRKGG